MSAKGSKLSFGKDWLNVCPVKRKRGGEVRVIVVLVLVVMDYRNKSGNDGEGRVAGREVGVDGGFFSGWSFLVG